MTLTLRLESPAQADVADLLQRATDYLLARYPADACQIMDLQALQADGVHFWVARQQARAVGCCALVPLHANTAEIKRLYVDETARGKGLGHRLLETLEHAARQSGVKTLLLEAGIHQPEALGLYRKRGYRERGPYGCYPDHPLSIFMHKPLCAS